MDEKKLIKFTQVKTYNAGGMEFTVPGQYEVTLDGRPLGDVERHRGKWRAWTVCGGCTGLHLLPQTYDTRQEAAEALLHV